MSAESPNFPAPEKLFSQFNSFQVLAAVSQEFSALRTSLQANDPTARLHKRIIYNPDFQKLDQVTYLLTLERKGLARNKFVGVIVRPDGDMTLVTSAFAPVMMTQDEVSRLPEVIAAVSARKSVLVSNDASDIYDLGDCQEELSNGRYAFTTRAW